MMSTASIKRQQNGFGAKFGVNAQLYRTDLWKFYFSYSDEKEVTWEKFKNWTSR